VSTPYFHLRAFWGGFDLSYGTPEYTGSSLVSAGTSAVAGSGVGVRRAVLSWTQTAPGTIVDDARETHFDFMNITGGSPDDTWTTTDFTDLETLILAWHAAVKVYMDQTMVLQTIKWYRIGTGVIPPNPPERILSPADACTSASIVLPPQNAMSITFKTARRRQWGRSYLPGITTAALGTRGALSSSVVDVIGGATNTMVAGAAAKQFYQGVLSGVAGSFFATEQVQVDDVADVIRSRRWKNTTHRYDS
jgi:hypothetical protein